MRSVDHWEGWKCLANSYSFGRPKSIVMRPVAQKDGGRTMPTTGWRGRWAAVPGECPKWAAAFDGIRTGGQGNGHKAAPALPGACLDHEYRALHGDVAGALKRYLALICDWRWTRSVPAFDRDLCERSRVQAAQKLPFGGWRSASVQPADPMNFTRGSGWHRRLGLPT